MKNLLKLTCIIALLTTLASCDNDDNAPNQNQCNYAGLTILDPNDNTQTLIPESDLTTDFFPNGGGQGIPAVEVYQTSNPGNVTFVTNQVTLNASGDGKIRFNGTSYAATVTCQRAGTNVGDELRFDIVLPNGEEGELCVIIDNVTP